MSRVIPLSAKTSRRLIIAWSLAAAAILLGVIQIVLKFRIGTIRTLDDLIQESSFALLIPLLFGILGALIVSKQDGNRVGWLMLLTALAASSPSGVILGAISSPPETLSLGLFLGFWVDGWGWIFLIFPIFLLPLHFPNGKPPSPRWNWVSGLAFGLWLLFASLSLFAAETGPVEGTWAVPNPIGFIPLRFFEGGFLIFWGIGLMTTVAGSVTSLFVRYRRAGQTERLQIRLLLFAGVIFFVIYGLAFFLNESFFEATLLNLMFTASLLIMPVAIAIAILRYRLYDIDLIIRRTLQYSLLTGMLALVYFGGVIVLQEIAGRITGERSSPLVTVISTLGIAALFNPLRRRVQDFIDRRFFRSSYDAEQVLASFAAVSRDEVDLDRLAGSVLDVVSRTVQPVRTSLWISDRSRAAFSREALSER
jgi:hypothetical protein